MHSWLRGVVAATVATAALAVSGCTPSPVDGDLTGDWADFGELTQMRPEVGACHNGDYRATVALGIYYQPRECTEPHQLETAYVGTFAGETAERDSPPRQDTPAWREAYAECEDGAAEYLGADFRHGWLWLGVGVPTAAAWDGGARWFRCDLTELRSNAATPLWPESRRGALAAGPSELTLDCFTVTLADTGEVETMDSVDCAEPHQAEFVGVWHSDQPRYPDRQAAYDRVHRGCREVALDFVGDPPSTPFGTIFDHISDEDWDNGDRGFRCYLLSSEEDLIGSLARDA